MSISRSPIISLLQEAYTQPDIKHCCLDAKNKLQRGDTRARIFDDFPSLLPTQDIQSLTLRLSKFLEEPRSIRTTSLGIQIASLSDVLIIRKLIRDIAKVGCVDLLDENGFINSEITQLLGWDVPLSRQHTSEVLHAYVGAINQVIMQNLSALMEKHSTTIMGLFDCINKNYGKWTDQIFADYRDSDTRNSWQKNRAVILTSMSKPHVFDECNYLLPEEEMADLQLQLQKIFNERIQLKIISEPCDDFGFEKIVDRHIVKRLVKYAASISCDELVDQSGQFRKEIRKLLEWQEVLNEENICEIIFDHVYAITQAMMAGIDKIDVKYSLEYNNLCEEITQNYRAWTFEIIKAHGIMRDSKKLESIGVKIGVGIGMGALALASLAGILLFRDYPALSNATTLKNEPKPK